MGSKIVENIRVFIQQSYFSFKALFGILSLRAYLLIKIINPTLQLMFFCLLLSYVYKTNDLTPWVIGNAFLLCTYNALFGVGITLIAERFYGTLKLIVVSPSNKFIVFLGRGFFHMFDSLSSVIVGLIVGFLFFNFRIPLDNIPMFSITLLVCMFAASSLGLLIGSVGLLVTDINLLLNTVTMVLLTFTGANFPIDRLPLVLQKFSYTLPITRSIEAARLIASNEISNVVYRLVAEEFVVGLIYLTVGYATLITLERIAVKKGTLEVY